MAIITNADLNALCDELDAVWLRALGTSASGYGVGTTGGGYGAAKEAQDLYDLLTTMTVPDAITALAAAAKELRDVMNTRERVGKSMRRVLAALETHVKAESSSNSLDAYLTLKNTGEGTKWQTLQHHSFRDVFEAWKTGTYPAVENLYFEVLQGAYANALRKLVVGTGETAGFAIDSAKYAGGFPKLEVSGFAGSADTVTVTGTQFDPATKTTTAGKTWTVSVTGNGTFTLAPGGATPAATDSLIVAVSSIVAGASITAGTIYAEAHRPSGRALPV